MEVPIYNTEKVKIGNADVPKKMFGSKWNPDLVSQAVRIQMANSRNIVAHAKDRSEVSGGGKKPWKQKGTGRARHGSIRSPLWIGGGVTHGPLKTKVYARIMPKKMKLSAIFSILSKKFSENNVFVIEGLSFENKTKSARQMLGKILSNKESAAIVLSSAQKEGHRALKNIPKISYISPMSLNVVDLSKPKNIIIEKEAVEEIIKHYKLSDPKPVVKKTETKKSKISDNL